MGFLKTAEDLGFLKSPYWGSKTTDASNVTEEYQCATCGYRTVGERASEELMLHIDAWHSLLKVGPANIYVDSTTKPTNVDPTGTIANDKVITGGQRVLDITFDASTIAETLGAMRNIKRATKIEQVVPELPEPRGEIKRALPAEDGV